jgi:beta-lactamase class A
MPRLPRARFLVLVASIGTLLGASAARAAPDARLAAALPGIEKTIADSGAEVAVAFRTLDGKEQWFFNADQSFHAASTMKVAVMIELFHQAHQGNVRLDEPLPVRNEFKSLADGSPFSLDPNDDSEKELYQAVGATRTLRELNELMITVSSNLATNLLMDKLGIANIRAGVTRLHAQGLEVLRDLEDSKAFEQGRNNTTTARALLVLLQAIAQGTAVDGGASAEMLAVLERHAYNDDILAGVPPGTRVAHKAGEITKIRHDAAVVYAPDPYVLVVLTRGLSDGEQAAALIAALSRQFYAATQPAVPTAPATADSPPARTH